ncbi:MAG: alpha/beta fold hydrolase [Salinibacter sp.]|uniref:alpha/beta fold hydrolase n=1 Tax=Salinibacter sp. TaxID=2065818 RepID=UPI0035D4876A
MHETPFPIHETGDFRYNDEGPTDAPLPPIVLLHGMLGDLSNWVDTIEALSEGGYRVLAPILPVYDFPLSETGVPRLTEHVRDFVDTLGFDTTILVGNSLGGHIALLHALNHAGDIHALILSGSSGVYETTMGSTFFRRQDRDFIRERTEMTFHDPAHATEELVDEMVEIVNDRPRAFRLLKIARSADEETVTEQLSKLDMPSLLVWGRNDIITPPEVAEEFRSRMPNARLEFIDECGHAPMIEHPDTFNELTLKFLAELSEEAHLEPSSGA